MGRRTDHSLLKALERLAQAIDDRFALSRDSFALKSLAGGLSLGPLYSDGFVCFTSSQRGLLLPTGRVNIVHCLFDFLIGYDVGDQSLYYRITEMLHRGIELLFNGKSYLALLFESIV